MIFRVLVVLIVTNEIINSEVCGFESYMPPEKIKGGFIYSLYSTSDVHSVEMITIDKTDLEIFKEIYKVLNPYNVIPRIVGASETKVEKELCHFYFENLFAIDLAMFPNTFSLKQTFSNLVRSLYENSFYKQVTFNQNSFRYNPITDSFFFIDFYKMKSAFGKTNDKEYISYLNKEFTNFLLKTENSVLESDKLADLRNSFAKDRLLYFEEYHNRKTLKLNEDEFKIHDYTDFNIFSSVDRSNFWKLDIKIESTDTNFVMTATLNDKTKTFRFKKDEDFFSVFLCQKSDRTHIGCMNFSESDNESNPAWTFKVSPGQRIDVEVQEAVCEVGKLEMKFYKIYLILTPENTPGVVPENEFLVNLKPDMIGKEFYIICETNHRDLRVVSSSKDKFEFKSVTMISRPLENKTGKIIYQVSPSIFPEPSKSCRGTNKKIFIMEKDKDQSKVLLIDRTDDKEPAVIFKIDSKQNEINQDLLMKCNQKTTYSNLFGILNPKEKQKNDDKPNIYPEKTVLIECQTCSKIVTSVCLESINNDNSYQINYELEDLQARNSEQVDFKTNFNSEKAKAFTNFEDKPENLVKVVAYLSNKLEMGDLDFKFKNFELPTFEVYRIYLSVKLIPEEKYEVRAIFFIKDDTVREIKNNSKGKLTLSKKPTKILSESKNDKGSWNANTHLLGDSISHYLSNSEIVYSIKIDRFEECNPYLESKTDELIEIKCSDRNKKVSAKTGEEIKADNKLTEGLEKIYNQLSSQIGNQPKKNELIIL